MSSLGWLRKLLLGISPEEATVARRGFRRSCPPVQRRLEAIGRTFLRGYTAALDSGDPDALQVCLAQIECEMRGFAFEGAAMALALFDFVTPWKRNRVTAFLRGPGDAHAYMVLVGVGWAAARIPWIRRNIENHLNRFDPLLRWLPLDGYGFHQGYFHWPTYIRRRAVVDRLSPYARRAFDQGLGRSLWFVEGADVSQIRLTVNGFAEQRRPDLWSGVGLACAYAGGVDGAAIEALRDADRRVLPQIAQGAAFAAKARQRGGNPAEHTELACRLLCGMPATAAAAMTDACLEDLSGGSDGPAYEQWRKRIQQRLAAETIGTR